MYNAYSSTASRCLAGLLHHGLFYLKLRDDLAFCWWLVKRLWKTVSLDEIIGAHAIRILCFTYSILLYLVEHWYNITTASISPFSEILLLPQIAQLLLEPACGFNHITFAQKKIDIKCRVRCVNLIENVFFESLSQYWFFHKPLISCLVFFFLRVLAVLRSTSPLGSPEHCVLLSRETEPAFQGTVLSNCRPLEMLPW